MVAARFRYVVETLSGQILDGTLPVGGRLPTQSELADRFGIAPATAARVYRELRLRGLAIGEIGRGTFVRGPGQPASGDLHPADRSRIDLGMNAPILDGQDEMLRLALQRLLEDGDWPDLLRYHPPAGRMRDREAAALWFGMQGLDCRPEDILVTAGAQHAICVALLLLCRPGDVVAVEDLTYPGVKAVAAQHHLKLLPLRTDHEGIVPSALAEGCGHSAIRVLYCMPTIQNPLGCVMSEERRGAIAALCERHAIHIVEDDAYAFLAARKPRPLSAFAPRISVNIQSLSKALAPGLRIGYMRVPEPLRTDAELLVRSTIWTTSPIMAAVASQWIGSGAARELVERKRRDATMRQTIARTFLASADLSAHPSSYHVWLRLPDGVRSDDAVRDLDRRGVVVSAASAFAPTSRNGASGIRLALATPPIGQLADGLTIVAEAVLAGDRGNRPPPLAAVSRPSRHEAPRR